ncbi:hypothetical protein BDDG_12407 [Blastomyces dermatitidis ATCC 18188]|uniref:Uncharacterized protein n=1 Tax=Ajellomyces dermatitidis (strain ATCC 18188 / CBS 674.68) TaxID=653446 RepID=A0A0J9ENM8_AJEDA|nr:hypothetical protein BDDG_12407 [Blastomyces dermatitidis ATCC 18188]
MRERAVADAAETAVADAAETAVMNTAVAVADAAVTDAEPRLKEISHTRAKANELLLNQAIQLKRIAPMAEWLMRPPGSALAWETKACEFETRRGYIKSGTQAPQVSNKYRGVQIAPINRSMFLGWEVIITCI